MLALLCSGTQFGPSQLLAGIGLDVRPQPHIGLVSLSYLFEGQIQHRDSLGSSVICRLGAVSLMLAGAGQGSFTRNGQMHFLTNR